MASNNEFLSALFGDDLAMAHVTDFKYDPMNVPKHLRHVAWGGGYFQQYSFHPPSNQYFTISTFFSDEGKARRRGALFRATHVIVLDDVREKLPLEQVNKLPPPTYVLETSPGSEQWGYKLTQPATDRHRVDNLLDGLVTNGLAPQGKDPGMKGVTRYVRLPEGINNKASKLVNGQPHQCRLLQWNPWCQVSLEQLAEPFFINLDALRREQRVDGAASIDNHPLLQVPDLVEIKEERSNGRYEIVCPWVDEHTNADDSGAAIFTNNDGSIGFKCHHGACQHRTGNELLDLIEQSIPDFRKQLKDWQVTRELFEFKPAAPDFTAAVDKVATPEPEQPKQDPLQDFMDKLRSVNPGSDDARECAAKLLQAVDDMPQIDRLYWHDQIRDVMHWSKVDFKAILNDLREKWYAESRTNSLDFFSDVVYVKELNQFYERRKRIFYTPEAYQNAHSHLDEEARKQALQGNMVCKVDKLDYAPLQPPVFEERGITYGNSWSDATEVKGREGDISCWLQHFDTVGWSEHRDHFIQWMAYTLQHPDKKINHMMLLGSQEGVGKDWLLYPLQVALGENHALIEAEELLSGYAEWALGTKLLHFNEADLGDRQEAKQVSNKIKPLATAPPDYIRINQKHVKHVKIRNLLSVVMTTNSQLPLQLNQDSRRIFALWSHLNVRDNTGQSKPEWVKFWTAAWDWMKGGGAEHIIHYLRHEVDVSNFNPGTPPPVTQFLRDIRDASKSPMEQTIEAFIHNRLGCFKSDLVTNAEMIETFKIGPVIGEQYMYADRHLFTPARVGVIMRQMPDFSQLRARKKRHDLLLWAVRDAHIYCNMGPAELYDEHERQSREIKKAAKLKVVS